MIDLDLFSSKNRYQKFLVCLLVLLIQYFKINLLIGKTFLRKKDHFASFFLFNFIWSKTSDKLSVNIDHVHWSLRSCHNFRRRTYTLIIVCWSNISGSLGIAPTRNCTHFLKIGFVDAGGGFYFYYIHQGNKSDKDRKIVRKKNILWYKKI